jgi:diacylglycerol kinase family enzyme
MFTGRALRSGELDLTLVEAATISLRGSQVSVALDGELVTLSQPLEYRIRPSALAVLVPRPEPSAT